MLASLPNKANAADLSTSSERLICAVRQDEINIITSFAEIAKTGKSGR